jgi:hypothetical protein
MCAVCFLEGRSYVVNYAGSRIGIKLYCFEGEGMDDWRGKDVEL